MLSIDGRYFGSVFEPQPFIVAFLRCLEVRLRTCIFDVERERRRATGEALLQTVALCDDTARVAMETFHFRRSRLLFNSLDEQTRRLRDTRRFPSS